MKCLCPMRSMQRKDRVLRRSPISHSPAPFRRKHARKMLGIASIDMNPTCCEVNDRQLISCGLVTKICSMMKCLRPLRSMQRKERRWGKENRFREKLLPPLFNAIEFKKSPPSSYQLPLQFEQNRTIKRTLFTFMNLYFYPHLLCLLKFVS